MEIVGLNEENIKTISKIKGEEDYFYNYRLDSYKKFIESKDPSFGIKYNIDFDKIIYYKNNEEILKENWDQVSCSIKDELNDLGVLDSEKKMDVICNKFELFCFVRTVQSA